MGYKQGLVGPRERESSVTSLQPRQQFLIGSSINELLPADFDASLARRYYMPKKRSMLLNSGYFSR